MSEVKRYECTDTSRNYMHSCGMEEDSLGDYVLHSDYEKLKAQLERAEEALNFYSRGWQEGTFVDEKHGTAGFCGRRAREYFKEKEQV